MTRIARHRLHGAPFAPPTGTPPASPSSRDSSAQPPIERIRKHGESPDACRIRVARIDKHVVGLRHEHAADFKAGGPRFLEPSIAPGAGHREAPPPIGRQLRFLDTLECNALGNLDLDEAMRTECIEVTHAGVNQHLENRGGWVRCAVQDLLPARVPACRGEEPSPPVEGLVVREAPEDHALREHAVLDADQELLDRAGARFARKRLKRRAAANGFERRAEPL
jgi:hypothetical protein